jgi:twitching motility two-component system response regulator PilH
MPDMHGLDICRALNRNPKTKVIPVIIYSALGTVVDMMLDERDKADAYISKPFTQQELLEKVQEQLE